MTLPLTSPFTDNTFVNKAQLDNLVLAINAEPFGYENESTSGSSVTLSTNSAFAGLAPVTVIVPASGRRYRIFCYCRFQQTTTTNVRFTLRCGYNIGSTAAIGSFVGVGQTADACTAVAGVNGLASTSMTATVFLAAGTYTFYAAVTRLTNGSVTDTASNFATVVDDIGPV